jgi:hypothetical protein
MSSFFGFEDFAVILPSLFSFRSRSPPRDGNGGQCERFAELLADQLLQGPYI